MHLQIFTQSEHVIQVEYDKYWFCFKQVGPLVLHLIAHEPHFLPKRKITN